MKIEDDRTEEQKKTHYCLIGGTDSFLSGWGGAEGGVSYAFWACESQNRPQVEKWVRSRTEMKRFRIVGSDYRPKGVGHCHIYVVTDGHNALKY